MAIKRNWAIEAVKRYIMELKENDVPIQKAIIFGSYAKGNPKEESDIDVVLISSAFTGNRFNDRRKIIPFRRGIDFRIEPVPFTPEDFKRGGNFIDEIKKTGKVI